MNQEAKAAPDTKYAVWYWSQSKGRNVAIESLHSSHLINAFKNRYAAMTDTFEMDRAEAESDAVLAAMKLELVSRGFAVNGAEVEGEERKPEGANPSNRR